MAFIKHSKLIFHGHLWTLHATAYVENIACLHVILGCVKNISRPWGTLLVSLTLIPFFFFFTVQLLCKEMSSVIYTVPLCDSIPNIPCLLSGTEYTFGYVCHRVERGVMCPPSHWPVDRNLGTKWSNISLSLVMSLCDFQNFSIFLPFQSIFIHFCEIAITI